MWVVRPMEHRGIQYQVVQTANPTGWKWTIELAGGRTKTGASFSRGNAIFNAVRAIDNAIKIPLAKE
jgi:hypothetical protein